MLVNIVDENAGLFEERDLAGMKKYLASFFELIRKDDYYKRNVAEKCRTQ
jgi:hypothetical protein